MSAPVPANGIRCSECHREVDEFTAIKERWGFWSDGCGELLPYCPECAKREFAPEVPASSSTVGRQTARAPETALAKRRR